MDLHSTTKSQEKGKVCELEESDALVIWKR